MLTSTNTLNSKEELILHNYQKKANIIITKMLKLLEKVETKDQEHMLVEKLKKLSLNTT